MIRDKLGIFQQIKEDLQTVYNTPVVVAVGSRVTERTSGKNDFDVLAQVPTYVELRAAPFMTPERLLFSQRILALGSGSFKSLFEVYLHYTMPTLRKKWAALEDEYANPVHVDVGWTDKEFPGHAVIL